MHARRKFRRRLFMALAAATSITTPQIADAVGPEDLNVDYFGGKTATVTSDAEVQVTGYALQDTVDNAGIPDVAQPGVPQATTQPMPSGSDGTPAQLADPVQLGDSGTSVYSPEPSAYSPMESMAAPVQSSACSCSGKCCCTKKKKEAATAAMKGAYKGVFYANDFSYLSDPCYDGPSFFGDSLKGLAGGALDIGGEARVRYHSENNFRARVPGLRGGGAAPSGLGLTGNDDDFFLTRLRLFANYRVNEVFRLYGEYLYADSGGEFFNNRPIEENRGEIQNLFLDTRLTDNLVLRVGRQELIYGAQRLISPLDWANTRRTFSGARGLYKGENWDIDGFFVHPVARTFANESKIDDADEDQDFYGVYATRKGLDIGLVDAYYLGYENQRADFRYHTIGTRISGKTEGGLLYETEGGVQFGENSPGLGSHDAGFFTGGLGRQLTIGDWKPTLWLWYDWASGEEDFNQAARGDNGFDHLFPLAHKYNGFMDLFGRRNLHDYNAQFITPFLSSKVKLLLWYHYFRLDEQTTPYDVVMQPYNTVSRAASKDLGHEIDVLFNITINPRHNVLIGYSHFNSGDYYEDTPGVPDNDADFFYSQYQWRF